MKPIRIMRIVARLNIGGPAVHVVRLIAGLDKNKFESILVVGKPHQHEGDMHYLAEECGIEPIVVDALGPKISLWKDLVATWQICRLIRRHKPTIVETHTAKAGTVGRIAAWLAGVPIRIHVFHGHVFHSYFGVWKTNLFIAIERWLARITHCVITICESQRDEIVDEFRICPREKTRVIRLGFDLEPFVNASTDDITAVRHHWRVADDAKLIGFVGRLTAIKRPELILQAARIVCDEDPQAHFVFVGDGELGPSLQEQTAELGLTENISFVGWSDAMPAVYSALGIVVLSSANEGTPVTLIEALAAGTPVIATDVGGVSDIVRDEETGLLVQPGDASAIAAAILRFTRDPNFAAQLATRGQGHVRELWASERMITETSELYLKLAERT